MAYPQVFCLHIIYIYCKKKILNQICFVDECKNYEQNNHARINQIFHISVYYCNISKNHLYVLNSFTVLSLFLQTQ